MGTLENVGEGGDEYINCQGRCSNTTLSSSSKLLVGCCYVFSKLNFMMRISFYHVWQKKVMGSMNINSSRNSALVIFLKKKYLHLSILQIPEGTCFYKL